jgi:hypothetical protein
MNWNWYQRRLRLVVATAVLACGLALSHPGFAHAAWPLESCGAVVLGFGDSYRSADATTSAIHHGVDVAAAGGDRVIAPLAGRVTFAGSVPAEGGGTVKAVTLSTASGSITLMPLASLSVAKGAQLAEGESVGELAAAGDRSSATSHLHVGLKRGGLYLDPMSVLALPSGTADGSAAGAGAAAPRACGGSARAGAAASAARPLGARAPAAAGEAAPARAPAARVKPLRAAVPGMQLAPGVSVGGAGLPAPATPPAVVGPLRALAGSALPVPAAHAPTPVPLTVAQLAGALVRFAVGWLRAVSLGLLGVMAALGGLWPLWRRPRRKGLGEERVSAVRDDVAAVVGR